ncbi:MAG: HYR domain-containing protein, partial [Planctomycetota bacterium]
MTTTPPSGSFFPTGVTTVTVNSIDACGNASACAFDVLVSCFGVNRAKIGTKPARCEGIELLEVTSLAADGSELVCLTVPGPGETELPSNVTVDDGVNGPQTIHTSCSQPIEIGDVFGYYTVTDVVKIFDSSPDARGNDIDLRGTFVPAVPIDFALDDVSFTIDDGAGHLYFFDIPAGSFQGHGSPEKQEFEFEGMIDGMEVKTKFEGCGYRLKVKGVPGASDIVGTTLTLGLLAGANGAQEVVVMEDKSNHLKFKRAPKVNCCPV